MDFFEKKKGILSARPGSGQSNKVMDRNGGLWPRFNVGAAHAELLN
jgi:hypothetical protein